MLKIRGFRQIALLVGLLAGAQVAHSDSDIGVLVLAQSDPRPWSKIVNRAVRDAELRYPTKVFLGSADSSAQVGVLQEMVRDLESSGANTIMVIPIVTSPYSPAFRQWKYLLGVDVQPGYNNMPLFPVSKNSTVKFSEPLNDSAVVVEILLDRISEISRKPEEECVVVVAPGTRDDVDNENWERILQNVAARIKTRGRYKSVEGATIRDEAASEKRQEALRIFRQKVDRAQRNGRAIVVPLTLNGSAIEHKISLELRGIAYTYNNKALLPDSRISEWIRSQLP